MRERVGEKKRKKGGGKREIGALPNEEFLSALPGYGLTRKRKGGKPKGARTIFPPYQPQRTRKRIEEAIALTPALNETGNGPGRGRKGKEEEGDWNREHAFPPFISKNHPVQKEGGRKGKTG